MKENGDDDISGLKDELPVMKLAWPTWPPEILADLRERINQQARPKDTNNDRPTARR